MPLVSVKPVLALILATTLHRTTADGADCPRPRPGPPQGDGQARRCAHERGRRLVINQARGQISEHATHDFQMTVLKALGEP